MLKAARSTSISRTPRGQKVPKRTTRTAASRPKRPLRVVVMMSEEEHDQLLALCDDDVRPVASWFRVVVRRAWESRKPRRGGNGTFQRQEDDGQRRRVEVWTRLSEDERDQLDVLAGEEDVSVAVWYRRRLREDFASRFNGRRRPTPAAKPRSSTQPPAAAKSPSPRSSAAKNPGPAKAKRSGAARPPRRGTPRR
jgi:hypothetical protein